MAEPFTVDHFEAWSRRLVLDTGEFWRLEWYQREFADDIFQGRPENWQVVPEGNGKTTMIAGLGLYGLRFAEEANIPIAASTRDQAKIMYRQAKGFLRRSSLDEDGLWFEAFDGYRRIDLRTGGRTKRGEVLGFMEVHAADSGSGDGVIPFPFAILDELHRHKNLALYLTWLGKYRKRKGQVIAISTAGAPGSEFEEARTRIRSQGVASRRGRTFLRVEGPGLVLHEHAVPEDGDVEDLELVAEANPFSGITAATLAEKRASLTMTEAHWKRFTCNIAAQTEAELFIEPVAWQACGPVEGDAPVRVEDGMDVCVGADGSRTWDTTVLAWAAPGERIDVGCRVFSVRADAPHHVLHHGGKVDFEDVEESLFDLFERYEVQAVGYDPRYLERTMEIADARLPEMDIIAIEPQSKAARDAYQALFTAVVDGKLRHDGDPVIAAHLANCAVDRDDRNQEIRRLRKIDPRKPIDAVPALAFAVWQAVTRQPAGGELLVVAA